MQRRATLGSAARPVRLDADLDLACELEKSTEAEEEDADLNEALTGRKKRDESWPH